MQNVVGGVVTDTEVPSCTLVTVNPEQVSLAGEPEKPDARAAQNDSTSVTATQNPFKVVVEPEATGA